MKRKSSISRSPCNGLQGDSGTPFPTLGRVGVPRWLRGRQGSVTSLASELHGGKGREGLVLGQELLWGSPAEPLCPSGYFPSLISQHFMNRE